jgi:hypothetical protein
MATRAERQRERIARLLDQVQSSAQAWADAEYQVGIATGRTGAVSAQLETIRGRRTIRPGGGWGRLHPRAHSLASKRRRCSPRRKPKRR